MHRLKIQIENSKFKSSKLKILIYTFAKLTACVTHTIIIYHCRVQRELQQMLVGVFYIDYAMRIKFFSYC